MMEKNEYKIGAGYIDMGLLAKARDVFGTDSNVNRIQEVCIELALAILKQRTCGYSEKFDAYLKDKLADAKIAILLGILMFSRKQIDDRVDFKMKALSDEITEREKKEMVLNKQQYGAVLGKYKDSDLLAVNWKGFLER